eukprot:TRINITY_DN11583_c0_g3_i1.p1 TRINITY_DN11583_c0_g3~~TRINITY_DN11583_c0_g3_i1.p1  ORF type:complete len:444 (-),score=58.76 TRINITY_DN11583_c0_g3_i1:382-1713(-)
MEEAIGWFGPLIDLSEAAFHIGCYVQLLVFLHTSRPIQKFKASNRGPLLRTDIQVGDDTRSYFSVTLWQKHMGSMICAGDIILLQNVKIAKFGDVLEAVTVPFSSLLSLVHPYEVLASSGVDEVVTNCRVGITTKAKLKRLIEWLQHTGPTLHNVQFHPYQKRQLLKNWKMNEEIKSQDCISISEVLCLNNSCNATFYACTGEIFLPFTWTLDGEIEKEKMFVSKRLHMLAEDHIVDDLICIGCKLCGSPMDSGTYLRQNTVPLHCEKSSNHLHVVCFIYRSFLLYAWDQSNHIPLLVRNKAAEVLFGSFPAESVYACYKEKQMNQIPCGDHKAWCKEKQMDGIACGDHKMYHCNPCGTDRHEEASIESQKPKSTLRGEIQRDEKKPDFYGIWLLLLKSLLQQGKNSCLRFEVTVDCGADHENGKFELVSLTMPCYITNGSSN